MDMTIVGGISKIPGIMLKWAYHSIPVHNITLRVVPVLFIELQNPAARQKLMQNIL